MEMGDGEDDSIILPRGRRSTVFMHRGLSSAMRFTNAYLKIDKNCCEYLSTAVTAALQCNPVRSFCMRHQFCAELYYFCYSKNADETRISLNFH